jgi:hypothetical protein
MPLLLLSQVTFSPDGRWVLSASFDKSIKLWDGIKGTFVATFRNHVGPVFQVWAEVTGMLHLCRALFSVGICPVCYTRTYTHCYIHTYIHTHMLHTLSSHNTCPLRVLP